MYKGGEWCFLFYYNFRELTSINKEQPPQDIKIFFVIL